MKHRAIARGFPILALALAACGSRTVPGSSPTSEPAAHDAAPVATEPARRKLAIVELQIDGGQIWVSITNEVGASEVIEVGEFGGECAAGADTGADPDAVSEAVWAVDCAGDDGAVVRLRFVHREGDLIVLRAPAGSDEFEWLTRVEIPRDARVSFE